MKAIFIESGHGLKQLLFSKVTDPGACATYSGKLYKERDVAKEIGRRVLAILKAKPELGGVLIQGVGIETDATIQDKMKFVNNVVVENHFASADCLGIAIHMNSIGAGQATGFEVWHQINGASLPLAESMVKSWDEYKITPLRPKPINNNKDGRYGRFYTDDARCPYLIVETSFISNLNDLNAIVGNYDRVAECLAHGILESIRPSL